MRRHSAQYCGAATAVSGNEDSPIALNIGRFVDLLRGYADRAQFVVITHQKRTMEAADTLYGVTMGADGVSEIVSRRLPREQPLAATA